MLAIDEFLILVKGMKSVYARDKFLLEDSAIEFWYNSLKDIEYPILSLAVQKYVVNNKFAPTICDLRDISLTMTTVENDWGDGWQKVTKSFGRFGMYQKEKALESFDELTRKCVERLGYDNLCKSDNLMADRANFRMIYEELSKRKIENARLPQDVQNKISALHNKALGIGTEEPAANKFKELSNRDFDELEKQLIGNNN